MDNICTPEAQVVITRNSFGEGTRAISDSPSQRYSEYKSYEAGPRLVGFSGYYFQKALLSHSHIGEKVAFLSFCFSLERQDGVTYTGIWV